MADPQVTSIGHFPRVVFVPMNHDQEQDRRPARPRWDLEAALAVRVKIGLAALLTLIVLFAALNIRVGIYKTAPLDALLGTSSPSDTVAWANVCYRPFGGSRFEVLNDKGSVIGSRRIDAPAVICP